MIRVDHNEKVELSRPPGAFDWRSQRSHPRLETDDSLTKHLTALSIWPRYYYSGYTTQAKLSKRLEGSGVFRPEFNSQFLSRSISRAAQCERNIHTIHGRFIVYYKVIFQTIMMQKRCRYITCVMYVLTWRLIIIYAIFNLAHCTLCVCVRWKIVVNYDGQDIEMCLKRNPAHLWLPVL